MTKAKKAAAPAAEAAGLTAYKGLGPDFACRGHQYAVGQTYTTTEALSLCRAGFHACEQPLDALAYYPIGNGNRYAEVLLGGISTERDRDSKRVASSITIVREITVRELIEAQVAWTTANAPGGSASSGTYSRAASSGTSSRAASSGTSSQAASSGTSSQAASSGTSSQAASSGTSSQAASSGTYSQAASSGTSSQAASSGTYSRAASSGTYSQAASSGDYSQAACDTSGFACIAGLRGNVRGNAGSALSLGYQDAAGRNRIAVGYVGEDGVEPGVWYKADPTTGQLVRA